MTIQITGCNLTWALWHDYFVFLLHGAMRKHEVWLDLNFVPPRPYCLSCKEKAGPNSQGGKG